MRKWMRFLESDALGGLGWLKNFEGRKDLGINAQFTNWTPR
jgi:hypothetical protein